MANRPTVEAVFAGDASGLQRAMEKVGAASVEMGSDLDRAQSKAKGFGSSVDGMGSAIDASESKFMGAADLLDGLATTMGFNIDTQIQFARGLGDLAGGMTSTVVPAIKGVLAKLGLMTGATAAQTAATGTATAAQTGLNTAMLANPIGIVIAAIVALIGVGVLLYKNIDSVRNIVDQTWQFMQRAWDGMLGIIRGVFEWVKNNWPLLLAILTGPIGLAVLAVKTHFDTIKGFITSIPGFIAGAFSNVANLISSPFRVAADAVRSLWNNTIGGFGFEFGGWDPPGPGSIPGIKFRIPKMASGGIVNGPTTAVIGEKGPEAVIPLSRAGGMGLGTTVNVYIDGSVVSERELVDAIHSGLLKKKGRGGTLGLT